MKSLSPQRRDMMAVIALIIILCIAFPLIGSLASSRVPPPSTRTPTLAPTPTLEPTPTEEPTPTPEAHFRHLHLRAVQVFSISDLRLSLSLRANAVSEAISNSLFGDRFVANTAPRNAMTRM